MLNQLVESNANQKNDRAGFLLTTFVLVVGLFSSAILYSLFAKDLGIGADALELSTLVAPIQPTENTPPELMPKQERQKTDTPKNDLPNRQTNMLRTDETQLIPDKISVAPNTQKARPAGQFIISNQPEGDGARGTKSGYRDGVDNGVGLKDAEPAPIENSKLPEPPPALKKPPTESTPKVKPPIKSLGVVNGDATFLPKPVYPAAAKAVRAGGAVNVQILISESGSVVSAKAVDGHTLLRAEAEKAARDAKFKPTLLSGQPVKVSGVIVYKFSL